MDVAVIIPVGPYTQSRAHLQAMLDSLEAQTAPPAQVIVVDDGAHLFSSDLGHRTFDMRLVRNVWNLGEAASRNIGIVRADCEWVFDACHDDYFHPDCLRVAQHEAQLMNDPFGYYYVTLAHGHFDEKPPIDHQSRNTLGPAWEIQSTMGAQALYSRKLWASLGGYPKCGGVGLADICYEEIVMTHGGKVYPVAQGTVLYYHRKHAENVVTTLSGPMKELARQVSNENGRMWKPPTWTAGFGF